MIDEKRPKEELIKELVSLRQRTQELEAELSLRQSTDNTERKHIEDNLKQSEQEKSDILESISDVFYYLDREYRFTYMNKAAEKVLNRQRGEVIGRVVNEAFPTLTPEILEIYRQVMEERRPRHFETFSQILQRWIDASVYPSKEGLSVYLRDIHERKQAEEALRQSEERFYSLFHNSPAIMSIIRIKDDTFIELNQMFTNVFGYTRAEVIGRTSKELNLFADEAYEMKPLSNQLDEDENHNNHEVRFRTKSGHIVTTLCSMTIMDLNGESCCLTVIKDISARKEMEENIARLDRLNLIGEMAASIGHEIRNPMTTVRGFIQLLNEQKCYEKDKEFFDLMIEELDRANGIISEYLGMAKDKIVNLQTQYLDEVVKAIFPMLEADGNYFGITIKLELGKPPRVLIDKNEIRQLILNMARNGMEAMSSGGTLTISTTGEDKEIVLSIKDEGRGLTPEIMGKLGTPFITTKDNGTGLGLAVCYSIAARHNARIEVETGSKGTTFKVYFPKELNL